MQHDMHRSGTVLGPQAKVNEVVAQSPEELVEVLEDGVFGIVQQHGTP
jgi:hypothetical protein